MELQFHPDSAWKRSSKNLHETYQCRMYSRKLMMMSRGDARNMQSFITEQIWIIDASGWLFKKKSITMHGNMNVKSLISGLYLKTVYIGWRYTRMSRVTFSSFTVEYLSQTIPHVNINSYYFLILLL
jgi:hypothetical protein